MAFAPGDEVHVSAAGKGIVREVRNRGRYLVDVKGRSLVALESQLTRIESRTPRPPAQSAPISEDLPARSHAATSIDLHGLTVEAALAALDAFVNEAILAGVPELRIVHGKGTGRVKAAVHGRLRSLTVVRGFRLDPRNAGVTIVAL